MRRRPGDLPPILASWPEVFSAKNWRTVSRVMLSYSVSVTLIANFQRLRPTENRRLSACSEVLRFLDLGSSMVSADNDLVEVQDGPGNDSAIAGSEEDDRARYFVWSKKSAKWSKR
jgi:hypothetical protein